MKFNCSRRLPGVVKVIKFQLGVFIVFSAILVGPLVKLNGFYTSIKTCAYEYLISALISQC